MGFGRSKGFQIPSECGARGCWLIQIRGYLWLCLWQGIFNTSDPVSVFHYRPAFPDQESQLSTLHGNTSHLVAPGGLLEAMLCGGSCALEWCHRPSTALPGPPRRKRVRARPCLHTSVPPKAPRPGPAAAHCPPGWPAACWAGSFPSLEGTPTLRTGTGAAPCALSDFSQNSEMHLEAEMCQSTLIVLQEIQAHWAPSSQSRSQGTPKPWPGWALPGPADSRAVFPSCLHYLSWCLDTEGSEPHSLRRSRHEMGFIHWLASK